jgi:glyoxylase-like metal-dependent hydrolase (beta-lactamase superfamily II)
MYIERILARNPGPYTGPGTNTYLVGDDLGLAVIDPGPIDAAHEAAIVETIGDRVVTAVVVTHTHPDHAPLANPLARLLGATAYGYAPGPGFDPDIRLADGAIAPAGGVDLTAVHTPGHADDHLCLKAGGALFTGDHIMGGSSVMVERLGPYMASLERLQPMDLERLYPGHGPEMDHPAEVISWYLAHRRQREAEILAAIRSGCRTIESIVETVYAEVDSSLHPLAAKSVAAHLEKLVEDGLVVGDERFVSAEGSGRE